MRTIGPNMHAGHSGRRHAPVVEPEVTRTINVVTVAGRRFSPAVAAFVKAVDKFKWPPLSSVPKGKLKVAS